MQRRAKIVLSMLFLTFFGILVRVGLLTVDESVKMVGQTQGGRTIMVAEVRGTIYDRNLAPLVNRTNVYYATILPNEELLQRLIASTDAAEYARAREAIRDRHPFKVRLNGPVAITRGLQVYMAPQRYGSQCLAAHLLGYLDGDNIFGVSGIEKAYNDILRRYSGAITATYTVNGRGIYVVDESPRVENSVENSSGGVVLTLEKRIQDAVETALASSAAKGSAVVTNLNGEILALASVPTFRPDDVESHLDDAEGALVNRALSLYDCGSVFKIVTTLAAIENDVSVEQTYECQGAIEVDGHTFHCHYRLGHQTITMEQAFAQSCNVYYIQLAQQIGADRLLDTARKLGLTEDIVLAEGIAASRAVLPNRKDLSAPAALANFSFGQGQLLVSPLHVAQLTAMLANDGTMPQLSAVIGAVDAEGNWLSQSERGEEAVISSATATALRRMMERVVSEGTGIAAQPIYRTAAGKTGTAETGQIDVEGTPILHSWFTGYYPADQPKYVVTIHIEDIKNGNATAAEVFCEIINNLQ